MRCRARAFGPGRAWAKPPFTPMLIPPLLVSINIPFSRKLRISTTSLGNSSFLMKLCEQLTTRYRHCSHFFRPLTMLPPPWRTGTGWRWNATSRPRDRKHDGGRSDDKFSTPFLHNQLIYRLFDDFNGYPMSGGTEIKHQNILCRSQFRTLEKRECRYDNQTHTRWLPHINAIPDD